MLRYAVDHPRWRVHPGAIAPGAIARAEADFGALYARRWAFLTDRAPAHVALADGSLVAVDAGDRLALTRAT